MLYSIKQMELLSGVKVATIRMWEKRYNLFSPQRTNTNIRRYDDNDLRYIINISMLIKRGLRISKIACMSLEELEELASKFIAKGNPQYHNLDYLAMALLDFNEEGIATPIGESIALKGIDYTFEAIIAPFLKYVQELWQTGAVGVEHRNFAGNVMRSILNIHIQQVKKPDVGKNSPILFFLPESECNDIELLYFMIVAKNAGYRTVNLGASIPIKNAIAAAKRLSCEIVFTSLSSQVGLSVNSLLKRLNENLGGLKVILAGGVFNGVELPPNYTYVTTSAHFNRAIALLDPTMVE